MSEETTKTGSGASSAGCRSQRLGAARRGMPLRDDCRYRKARMLVLLALSASARGLSSKSAPASTAARELRRAAVAAGSTVIREHEGLREPIEPALGKLGDALSRGEREGWLDAISAEKLRRLSSELAAA
jgi:hypothetical protein